MQLLAYSWWVRQKMEKMLTILVSAAFLLPVRYIFVTLYCCLQFDNPSVKTYVFAYLLTLTTDKKVASEINFYVFCSLKRSTNPKKYTYIPVPEFIDPVFVKTSPKRSFSVIQNERFGLVFEKTGSIISGTVLAPTSLRNFVKN